MSSQSDDDKYLRAYYQEGQRGDNQSDEDDPRGDSQRSQRNDNWDNSQNQRRDSQRNPRDDDQSDDMMTARSHRGYNQGDNLKYAKKLEGEIHLRPKIRCKIVVYF